MQQDSSRKGLLQPALFYSAFVLALPLLPVLIIGRLVFFGTLGLWGQFVHWLRPQRSQDGRAGVLPFWLAWFVALLWIAVAIGGSVGVLARTEDWDLLPQLSARAIAIVLALASLFAAYRAALLGTQSLQRALAQNLAMLIAFELEQLRVEAEHRAQILHVGRHIELDATAGSALRVPGFFAEREEIRAVLGEPTERVLNELQQSLQNFNLVLTSRPVQKSGLGGDVQAHLMAVYEHLGRAMQSLGPHLRKAT